MAGGIWSKTFLILMFVIEEVLGNASSSENKIAFGQRTTPCHISYHEEGNPRLEPDSIKTRLDVYISTPWMIRKGCFLYLEKLDERNQDNLTYNSPGRCSLFCKASRYFGLRAVDMMNKTNTPNCQHICPNPSSYATCGSNHLYYVDVYEHDVEFQEDLNHIHKVKDQDNVKKTCMVVKKKDSKVIFKAVHCSRNYSLYCWTSKKEKKYYGEKSKAEADVYIHDTGCLIFGDDWKTQKDEIPNNNTFIWTSFIRSKICILKKYLTKHKMSYHSKCLIEKEQNWRTALLSLTSAEDTHLNISLKCNMIMKSICQGDEDNRGNDDHFQQFEKSHLTQSHTGKQHNLSTTIPIGSEYTFDPTTNSSGWKTTMTTRVESKNESTVEDSTSRYEYNTTNNPFLFDNSVFALQIGIVISVSCFVILIATLACCIYRPKRSKENIVMAAEGHSHQPTAVLADNYSDPVDIASTSNEMEGPRFCATESCQNTNCQKTENGEYQHLDFTLRSERAARFADNSEYDHVRANVVSVFEQPWDTATSKVNKLFSQISKSVVQKGQNMRKSLIKRRASRSGSPKLKCRASDYCDAWKTQLNNQQFVFDSDVDNQSNISIDIATSTVNSNKDESEFRRTDSAFPVLPYSKRINVKSTHFYDEPDDRRLSLRERLLHIISIRPLKMPFGIELDLRGSRSKSKIYSLATPIDEIDESVA